MKIIISTLISFIALAFCETDIIVTNHDTCTEMAKHYIDNYNATPPELAIIVAVCEGIVNPQDAGLGGGFQATIYNGYCNERLYLNSREKAPAAYNYDDDEYHRFGNIGVPSVLKGYEYLYNMEICGMKPKLEWKDLFTNNIELAVDGVRMTRRNEDYLEYLGVVERLVALRRRKIPNFVLARTLRTIANDGPSSSLYQENGTLHQKMVKDLQEKNSFIKSSDLLNYNVTTEIPLKHSCMGYKIATTRIPGSGATFILGCKIVEAAFPTLRELPLEKRFLFMYHTMRYMYSLKPYLRSTSLSLTSVLENSEVIASDILMNLDKPWNQKTITRFGNYSIKIDQVRHKRQLGTTNIVIKRGKFAITMTSTINNHFGSGLYSKRLGFFYNDQLNDFDELGTPNGPKPNKTPQSAISATILYNDQNEPVFQIGAAGGSAIIGSIFNTFFNYFVNNETLVAANKMPRCFPDYEDLEEYVYCERGIPAAVRDIFDDFEMKGYTVSSVGYSAVTASSSIRGKAEASFDRRRGGSVLINENSSYGGNQEDVSLNLLTKTNDLTDFIKNFLN